MTPVDVSEQWREDWMSASVVNNVLVTDRIEYYPTTAFCSVTFGQVKNDVWLTFTSGVHLVPHVRLLCLQSATDREPHC